MKMSKTGEGMKNVSCCGSAEKKEAEKSNMPCCPDALKDESNHPSGAVAVSSDWTFREYLEHIRCRISGLRMRYAVKPGLYAAGNPDKNSDVFVSANYKMSFDILRRALKGINAWILVLDTKGINVWCAAGKGTFSTDELIKRIGASQLEKAVSHRRIIVPQLGAPGIAAHTVQQKTGFRVCYGPVDARDIHQYCAAGYQATEEMRRVKFTFWNRMALTPMEMIPAMKGYALYAPLMFLIIGLKPSGILFKDGLTEGLPFIFLGLLSILAGAFATPLFLPFVPFRSFAVKGWLVGVVFILIGINNISIATPTTAFYVFSFLFFPLVSSYIALQFTGSTVFTSMSGVRKELRLAMPVYVSAAFISLVLLVIFKMGQWGVL